MQTLECTDTALTDSDDEETTLDLLTNTTGAHSAVTHLKKIAQLTGRSGCLKRDL
jgi:hypothetical protein